MATSASPEQSASQIIGASHAGRLIVNADDWGRDRNTTDRILDCCLRRSVSSASAMVFMEDSDRAAALASEHAVDTGLHLNFTAPFSAARCPGPLAERQGKIAAYLLRRRMHQVLFHPGLMGCFEYVVGAQIEEYQHLYGTEPDRIDGHHHMHLSANVLLQRLLPRGIIVRRNFSFQAGEKSFVNRAYRRAVDSRLARNHRLVDFLFSITPVAAQDRLQRISKLAIEAVVELETHPVNPDEYRFLCAGLEGPRIAGVQIAPRFEIAKRVDPKDQAAL